MTVREFLEQGIGLQEKIEAARRECKLLQKKAGSVRSPGFDAHYGSGSVEAPFVAIVEKLEEAEERLQAQMVQWQLLDAQITILLEDVPDDETRQMMRLHYLEGKEWKLVQKELARSDTYIRDRVRKAIRKLTLPEDAIDLSKKPKAEMM